MGLEAASWRAIRPALQGAGMDPQRVENLVRQGMPDVSYNRGWVELKAVSRWPVRGGVLALPHYTAQQRIWHDRRWRAGGLVWVLLRVGQAPQGQWLLFDGWGASLHLGRSGREELEELACYSGADPLPILTWLRGEPILPHEQAKLMRLRCCKTLAEVASDLHWPVPRVRQAENLGNSPDVLTLLDYWRS